MPEWPKNRLTRFEVARIIGARVLQISLGAPVLVKLEKDEIDATDTDIAQKEFREIKIPMTIKRPMPDGSKEIVNIKKAIKNWLEEHPEN
jgi:DNA-directed RNA polymerase subunit K/omega